MSRLRAATAVLLGLVFAGSLLAAPGGAAASEPCADGTPSAVRFAGLRERLPTAYKERFALDAGDIDWEVTGSIRVKMESGGEVFFDGTTYDPYAELWLRLDPGDTEATVTATFEQWDYISDVTCAKTVVRTVNGFVAPVRLICNRRTGAGETSPTAPMSRSGVRSGAATGRMPSPPASSRHGGVAGKSRKQQLARRSSTTWAIGHAFTFAPIACGWTARAASSSTRGYSSRARTAKAWYALTPVHEPLRTPRPPYGNPGTGNAGSTLSSVDLFDIRQRRK